MTEEDVVSTVVVGPAEQNRRAWAREVEQLRTAVAHAGHVGDAGDVARLVAELAEVERRAPASCLPRRRRARGMRA
jgi:hypothetical protein